MALCSIGNTCIYGAGRKTSSREDWKEGEWKPGTVMQSPRKEDFDNKGRVNGASAAVDQVMGN